MEGKNIKSENGNKLLNEWQDVPNDGSLDSFAESNILSSAALRRFSGSGVTILPNNAILAEASKDKNLFTQIAKDILVLFQDAGMQSCFYDDKKEKCELILDSADIVLPILLFAGNVAVSVGLNILANWIYDRWIKPDAKQPPSIKVEYLEIDQQGIIIRWRRIEGTAKEIRNLLSEEARGLTNQDCANRSTSVETNHKEPTENTWWIKHCEKSAKDAMHVAESLINEAEKAINEKKMDIAEGLYRRSLAKIREALLWEPEDESFSTYLHDIGSKIHDIFGCQLEFKDGLYWVTCPVLLSHSKGGFSIGGSGKEICSICGNNIFECPHVKGRAYDGVLAKRHHDICNICEQKECSHIEGSEYNDVRAFGMVTELDLDHISFVRNPANPLCVVYRYSVPKSDLLDMLPEDERSRVIYGETIINCHHCLQCKGN
jgi:hypothetical protein